MAGRFQHFALGPVLWNRVAGARAKSALGQTAWERGVASAASAFDQPRSPLGALQALVGGAVGLPIGNAVNVSSFAVQVLVGAIAALAAYWVVPPFWALVVALRAPTIQRNEARVYAQALEVHDREWEQWANRHDIADAFLWETFLYRDQILPGGGDHRPLDVVEAEWRAKVTGVATQLDACGASEDQVFEAMNGLTVLDTRDDGYGADHRRRVWNNMGVIPQNVRSTKGPRPVPPLPPGDT